MAIQFHKISFLVLLSIAFIAATELLDLAGDVIVQLEEGKIRGHILQSENGYDYYAFQEIPYAAPPVGKNRFQLPKKAEPWKGVLNTTKNTKICYQMVSQFGHEISEDCLFLNVYTPVKPGSNHKKLPVLFWIHGGGNAGGSGTFEHYGPKYIMGYDIVVVTINYRLGPFGFTTTADGEIPANIGLKDQKFALEWVNKNIHLFEGDSKKVTIVGQSSGSLSVGLHVLAQHFDNKGLIHAAIMQSGSILAGLVQQNPRENAFKCGSKLDNNFSSNKSSDLLDLLQKAPAASIIKACNGGGSIIEEDGDFSYAPLQSLMDGKFGKVPVMMGFTSEEFLTSAINANISRLVSLDRNPGQLVPGAINISPKNKNTAGHLLKEVYTNTSFEKDLGAYARWSSDSAMNIPVCKHVELIAPHMPVYMYQFSYYGPLGQNILDIVPGAGRVTHGSDNHYYWNNLNNSDLSKFPEEDRLTLRRFVKLWTNFVKYQNPTPEKDPLLENITWPKVGKGSIHYLNFNDTLRVEENPRKCKQLESILDNYIEPPFIFY